MTNTIFQFKHFAKSACIHFPQISLVKACTKTHFCVHLCEEPYKYIVLNSCYQNRKRNEVMCTEEVYFLGGTWKRMQFCKIKRQYYFQVTI